MLTIAAWLPHRCPTCGWPVAEDRTACALCLAKNPTPAVVPVATPAPCHRSRHEESTSSWPGNSS